MTQPNSTDSASSRVALVTGSSRGLGRAMALRLAADGFTVAVHYGRGEAEAQQVAEEIRAAGGAAQVFGADLSQPANAGKLVEDVIAALTRTFADRYGARVGSVSDSELAAALKLVEHKFATEAWIHRVP